MMSKNRDIPNLGRFKTAIVIVSDRAFSGVRQDETGPLLEIRLRELGSPPVSKTVIPDEKPIIIENLKRIISENYNLVLVSGGTGPAPRDVTPEATLEVIEKRIPGMEEHIRRESSQRKLYGLLSRGVIGIAGKCLIINLPGSPRGALENLSFLEPLLDHTLEMVCGEESHN